MKKADKISLDLQKFLSNERDLIIPNLYIAGSLYESDVVKITRSGYIYEFEIKTSRSDFFNDFKKAGTVTKKHDKLKSGESHANYFTFVYPKGLVKESEVPIYCGILEYNESSYSKFDWVRFPKRLNTVSYYSNSMNILKLIHTITARHIAYRIKINQYRTNEKNQARI